MLDPIHILIRRVDRKGVPSQMDTRLNPQPEPPRPIAIPLALLQSFKQDVRIVTPLHISGLIMVPTELLGELKAKLGANLQVLIVNKAEIGG